MHDKSLPGNDHYHAMDKNDLKRFISLVNKIHTSLGIIYQIANKIRRDFYDLIQEGALF